LDIAISTFERAVTDAVNLLTRTRFHRDAPLYLLKVQRPLAVTFIERTDRHAKVLVSCETWGTATLTLTLSEAHGNWLPWGPFTVAYGDHYPVASLSGKTVGKDIYPMYATRPDAVRHMELRVRTRVVR